VLPHEFLSPEEENSVYNLHENSADDPRYRRFLRRLFVPLSQRLAPNSFGLDFGSGPGPTLSLMFEEAGHSMEIYDPLYAPEIKLLQQQYDFISASEVVEHLHRPREELERLWSCLKPNGWLGIMTKRVIDQKAFARWHYKSDPTHVCFFSIETFRWLEDHWRATLTIKEKDVVLFTKSG
jgi:SAM-dependent methyltransferase